VGDGEKSDTPTSDIHHCNIPQPVTPQMSASVSLSTSSSEQDSHNYGGHMEPQPLPEEGDVPLDINATTPLLEEDF